MKISNVLALAICTVSASAVLAANSHEGQLQSALNEMKKEQLYPVEFPQCVLDFQSLTQEFEAFGSLNTATYQLNLAAGYFEGNLWLDLKEDSEFGEGLSRIEIQCGSGLASMVALPARRDDRPNADKGTLFRSTPNITQPKGGLSFAE